LVILSSRRMLEDDKMELAAQKVLEGWKTARQPLKRENPELEMSSTTCQKQETPSKATINLGTDKTRLAKKSCEKESGKKESDQASLEKLTTLALFLLEN